MSSIKSYFWLIFMLLSKNLLNLDNSNQEHYLRGWSVTGNSWHVTNIPTTFNLVTYFSFSDKLFNSCQNVSVLFFSWSSSFEVVVKNISQVEYQNVINLILSKQGYNIKLRDSSHCA